MNTTLNSLYKFSDGVNPMLKALLIKRLDWISTVLIVGPAALMAFYSPAPPMLFLYAAWIIGSTTATLSGVLRKSSALISMNSCLLSINVVGLLNTL